MEAETYNFRHEEFVEFYSVVLLFKTAVKFIRVIKSNYDL